MHRHLRGPTETVQQIRHPTLGVAHMEQPADQHRDPRQRPPLILHPPMRGRTPIQLGPQPGQPGLIQPAPATARALGPQPGTPVPTPDLPPLVDRLGRHPQPPRHLPRRHRQLKQVNGLHPHHLTALPIPRVQAAAIGVPHTLGIDPRPTEITATRRTNIDSPQPFGLSTATTLGPGSSRRCQQPACARITTSAALTVCRGP